MFYDRFVALCEKKGVTPSKAAIDAGLSKSTVTKWKNDPFSSPTGKVLTKLSQYFGISIADILSDAEDEPKKTVTDSDIKFALFGGSEEITDAMYEEVRSFAAYVAQREAAKRQKE